ncbi:GlxA family transcriptional regulator [Nocardia otitidiscaviarum]|uniref:GlxA family transcriptional regulator n=1 Tax=Nocardia otitidiscaviarum TaxID=1823 RepID=UPI002457CA14|nr:helix-turn-helix domain-containing protein [Nocardia otitidiscaviarum]
MAVPHRVVVLALDQVPVLELGIPSRVFGFAEDEGGGGRYEVVVCSADGEPVSTAEGLSVAVARGPEVLELADTVIVPPAEDLGELEHGGALPASLAAALARIRPGTRMVSICTGSYVLAAAGLLDGRIATTHWMHSAAFRRAYPRVQVDEDVLFVDNGDVLTAAGVAAGLDLCLHLVRRDHGAALANRVARRLIVPPWRDGGQAQFIERPVPNPDAASTAATRAWLLDRLAAPVTLDDMAAHARMSVRTFTRRFRAEVGVTPGRWLTAQRLDRARELLEHTDLSIDLVAERSGFGTGNSLRQHMRALLNTSPHAYRRTFRRAA